MKIYLLSYSTPSFKLSQFLLMITGRVFGRNFKVYKKQKELLNSQFYLKNNEILNQQRGGGYWLWKYYFINELMKEINDGDIIIYADSGLFFRKNMNVLVSILKTKTKGVLLFYNDYKNKFWTKRDCFVTLNCDEEKYYNSPLIFGGLQLFQKNKFSLNFIDEVLSYSCQDNLITDSANKFGKPNIEGFIEHRHDQSITSLIAHKYAITLYPDPSQFKTKDVIYSFPHEEKLSESIYKNIVYVHRLSGLRIFTLPFKLIKEFCYKIRK